jgi:DNA-binding transcriptional ArsR family regulator
MPRPLRHPTRDQMELPVVLDCLSDPIRLAIVYHLAQHERDGTELRCGDFNELSGKSNLAYHFAKLRDAGLMQTRIVGTIRLMKLRREDMDARFPGLIDAVLKSAARDAGRLQLVPECEIADAD